MHAPAAFHADRLAWRAVIYLNLVRSVRRYVSTARRSPSMITSCTRILDAISPDAEHQDDADEPESAVTPTRRAFGTRVLKYDHYRTSLEPLRELEDRLIRMLSSPDEIEPVRVAPPKPDWNSYTTPNYRGATGKNGRPSPVITIPRSRKPSSPYSPTSPPGQSLPSPGGSSNSSSKSKNAEVSVHTTSNWKKAFGLGSRLKSKSAHTNEIEGWWDDPSDPVHVVHACAQTMLTLWKDPSVKLRLRELKLRIEESSGL